MPNLITHLPDSDDWAIIDPTDQRLRFSELKTEVAELAGGLIDLGIEPGDRVVLLIPMSIDLYRALLALFHIGATATLVDPAADVQAILSRYPVDALVGVPKAHLLRLKVPALRGLKAYVSTGFTPLPHRRLHSLRGTAAPVGPDHHPALLTFTSGTTALPKAIARSHRFLLDQHHVLAEHMRFQPGDVDMPTLPVFLLHSLASGATCVIADADLAQIGAVAPGPVFAQLEAHRVSSISGSPAFFRQLADHMLETGASLPALRHIFTGGARVPATLVDDLANVLPDADLHVVYGSTEAEPIAVLDARANRSHLLNTAGQGALVGMPVEAIRLRIHTDELDGDFGEIWVSGPHVNPRYLDNPEAEHAHKVRDGDVVWHRTGDVGRLDDHGRLWLVGRLGESVGGLWPLATEGAAEALPWVKQAGLVAINDRPLLAVILGPNAPDDWSDALRQQTGAEPVSVTTIPTDKRHNAKVDRVALAASLAVD